MILLETLSSTKYTKCSCCSEKIMPYNKFLQVTESGKNRAGERYCEDCKPYAYINNTDIKDLVS